MDTGKNEHEDIEIEYHEEILDKKDYTIRVTLILITALTLIAAVGYYLNNYVQPEKGRVSLFESIFKQNAQDNTQVTAFDVLNAQNQQRVNNQNLNANLGSSASSSTTTPSTATSTTFVTPDENTFAPAQNSNASSTTSNRPKNIITEYIVRATSSSAYSTTTRKDVLNTTTSSKSLGITFKVDSFWSISTKTNSGVSSVIIKKVGPKAADVITMTRFQGTSVSTEDSRYGNVSYFFNASTSQWMKLNYTNSATLNATIEPNPFAPSQFTFAGLPIFKGTSAIKTLIIAFGPNDFLVININGTGYFDILDEFVKNIR